jgi:MtN3 and saliva related transmembrane protein
MNHFLIVGYIAGTLTTFSFLPQILKSYNLMMYNATHENKDKVDISISFLTAMLIGLILWVYYGILINRHDKKKSGNTIIYFNTISIMFVLLIAFFTLNS